MMVAANVPTIVITGFLGSGKTTFINEFTPRLQASGAEVAVLINEIGDVNVDRLLIAESDYCTEVNRGSIFCTCVQADLWAALRKIAAIEPDILLLEATGVAAPSKLDGVNQVLQVCLADAGNFYKIAQTMAAARWQASTAQVIIVTGSDKATAEQLALTQSELTRLNSNALVVVAPYTRLPETVWQMIIDAVIGGKAITPVVEAEDKDRPKDRPRDLFSTQLLHMKPLDNASQLPTVLTMLPTNTLRAKGFIYVDGHLHLLQYANGRAELFPAPKAVVDGGYLVVVVRR
jgi:G3E family GTPase